MNFETMTLEEMLPLGTDEETGEEYTRHYILYDSAAPENNLKGEYISYIRKLMDRAGVDIKDPSNDTVDLDFKQEVMAFQSMYGLRATGTLDNATLNIMREKAAENAKRDIDEEEQDTTSQEEFDTNKDKSVYQDAHYEPFFLNASDKSYRKNHKDIVISIGNGANKKTIKDVFMRSVSVEVDTSGKPISEVYTFIARDIKESDANEDRAKYIGEAKLLSASSDIKYTYETLFKDK